MKVYVRYSVISSNPSNGDLRITEEIYANSETDEGMMREIPPCLPSMVDFGAYDLSIVTGREEVEVLDKACKRWTGSITRSLDFRFGF